MYRKDPRSRHSHVLTEIAFWGRKWKRKRKKHSFYYHVKINGFNFLQYSFITFINVYMCTHTLKLYETGVDFVNSYML